MRILIIGFGSIGKRHYENFSKFSQVKVFDNKKRQNNSIFFKDIESSIKWNPDGVVISTPTDSHIEMVKYFLEKTKKILVEKPISNNYESAAEFQKLNKNKINEIFVVCNLRFHQALEIIKKEIKKLGKIFFVRAHFGNWLPNMRPNTDYKENYSASVKKGGGLIFDSIHEIDYLNFLFGDIIKIYSVKKKVSNLCISGEDICALIIKHKNDVISELHLDYLRPIKKRGCEIVGENGTLIWESEGKNPEKCVVKFCDRESNQYKELLVNNNIDTNYCYEILAKEFITSIENSSNDNLLMAKDAIKQLKIIENCIKLD